MSQAFSGTSGQWDSDSVSASRGWEPYVYTGNRWVKASSQNLSTMVAKEIAGKLTDNLSSVSTNLLPAWYRAGSSWFLARTALGESGVISYDDERWSVWVPNSRRADRPLKDLESWRGFSDVLSEGSGSPYQYLMLAIELLAAETSQTALIDFFSSTESGVSWRETFHGTFGMTLNEFHELFDEHRATGLPKPWQVLVISNAPILRRGASTSWRRQSTSVPHIPATTRSDIRQQYISGLSGCFQETRPARH